MSSSKGVSAPSGTKVAKPADNAGLLNSLVQVLWNLDAFQARFEQDVDATTVSSETLPTAAALATIFRQLEDAKENQIVRADIFRVALNITHASDPRLQMRVMDDAIVCFSAVVQHLQQELEARGKPSASGIVPETLLLSVAGADGAVATKYALTVAARSLLNPSLRNGATFTNDQLDLVTGLNLTETLVKYNLPNYHDRILDFGRLLEGAFREANGGASPALLNMPLALTIGITWADFSPSHEEVKAILAAICPVISETDFLDVGKQTAPKEDRAGAGSSKKKGGMFRRILGKPSADKDDDDQEREAIQASRLLTLRGLIAYHGSQFVSFYYNTEHKLWLFYDDARVSRVGPHFSEMITKVGRGRYQPVMLFYQAASNEEAKNTLRQFVSRRFSRRDESLFGHLETVELPIPHAANKGADGLTPAKIDEALGTVRLSESGDSAVHSAEDDRAKFAKASASASTTKSVQLTKGEALLAMQVQHRVTEKRMRYRHSFVFLRETKMGVFGKPKERFAILAKNVLAFYDATDEEAQLKEPLFLVDVTPACSVQEVAMDTSYGLPRHPLHRAVLGRRRGLPLSGARGLRGQRRGWPRARTQRSQCHRRHPSEDVQLAPRARVSVCARTAFLVLPSARSDDAGDPGGHRTGRSPAEPFQVRPGSATLAAYSYAPAPQVQRDPVCASRAACRGQPPERPWPRYRYCDPQDRPQKMCVRSRRQSHVRALLHATVLLPQLPGSAASRRAQRLHWRVHREACFGRTVEGQSAMEAASAKKKSDD